LARSEIIEITCDICGMTLQAPVTTADRTFSVDGQHYTIDLCVTHMGELETTLAPFTAAARREPARAARGSVAARPARAGSARGDLSGIREWARANGFPNLSDRGRVPSQVLAAWQAAGGDAGSGRARRGAGGRVRRATKATSAGKRTPRKARAASPVASSANDT
jgi:hypothetical protein